jgi:hypothetical protein
VVAVPVDAGKLYSITVLTRVDAYSAHQPVPSYHPLPSPRGPPLRFTPLRPTTMIPIGRNLLDRPPTIEPKPEYRGSIGSPIRHRHLDCRNEPCHMFGNSQLKVSPRHLSHGSTIMSPIARDLLDRPPNIDTSTAVMSPVHMFGNSQLKVSPRHLSHRSTIMSPIARDLLDRPPANEPQPEYRGSIGPPIHHRHLDRRNEPCPYARDLSAQGVTAPPLSLPRLYWIDCSPTTSNRLVSECYDLRLLVDIETEGFD